MGGDAQAKVRKKDRNLRGFHLKHWETGSFGRRTISHRAGLPRIRRMTELKMILFGLTSLFTGIA
ncbi:hypothetical protein [Methylomonas albis]|uniref:hypothetical protein n=1 Tax=Methylomonas albis TaxID=1854563 RepID=UPI001CE19ED2|nr:hypothetical protein [Methylomonas albis]